MFADLISRPARASRACTPTVRNRSIVLGVRSISNANVGISNVNSH